MSSVPSRKDLVVLVADKNIEYAIKGLLGSRAPALGIHSVTFDVFSHPEHDPGCYLRGHEILRDQASRYDHALVLFDCEGSGNERAGREVLEHEVEKRLASCGWGGRSAAVALEPELEVWVWSDSPHVETNLGWTGSPGGLRSWLEAQGLWTVGVLKPSDPKRAVERTLQQTRKQKSSTLYKRLAEHVSLTSCTDEAFAKLRSTLKAWFGT